MTRGAALADAVEARLGRVVSWQEAERILGFSRDTLLRMAWTVIEQDLPGRPGPALDERMRADGALFLVGSWWVHVSRPTNTKYIVRVRAR